MYGREKLTIKGRASRRVFPSKNALQTKRPVFYSPGEFTGRRSETHRHKRKVEILRFRAKRELSSNLLPKRKNRPEVRSAKNQKMVEHFEAFLNFSLHLKTANFSSLKWVANSSSRKILREII